MLNIQLQLVNSSQQSWNDFLCSFRNFRINPLKKTTPTLCLKITNYSLKNQVFVSCIRAYMSSGCIQTGYNIRASCKVDNCKSNINQIPLGRKTQIPKNPNHSQNRILINFNQTFKIKILTVVTWQFLNLLPGLSLVHDVLSTHCTPHLHRNSPGESLIVVESLVVVESLRSCFVCDE